MAIGELTPFYERQRQVAQSEQEIIKLQAMKQAQADEAKARQLDMLALQQEQQAGKTAPTMPSMPPAQPKEAPGVTTAEGITTTPYDMTPPDITTTIKSPGGATATIEQLPKEAQDKLAGAKTEDEMNKIIEAYKPAAKPGAVEGYKAPTTEAAPTTTIADNVKIAGRELSSAQTAVKSAYDRAELYRKNGLLSKYKDEIAFAQDLESKQALSQERHITAQEKLLKSGSAIGNGFLESVKADPSQNNSNRAWSMAMLQLQDLGFPATELMKITDPDQRKKVVQQLVDSSSTGLDKLNAQLKESQIKRNLAIAEGKVTGSGKTSAVNQARAENLAGGVNELSRSLSIISNMDMKTTSGIFGTMEGGKSFFTAPLTAAGVALTTEDQRQYNIAASNIGQSLATIEYGGYKPTAGAIKTYQDKLAWKPTDTIYTKVFALADAKEQARARALLTLKSPYLPEEQKVIVQQAIDEMDRTIPFRPEDVTDMKKKGLSVKQWMDQKAKETQKAPAAKVSSAGSHVFTQELLDQLDSL